jgi:hypothetical protein
MLQYGATISNPSINDCIHSWIRVHLYSSTVISQSETFKANIKNGNGLSCGTVTTSIQSISTIYPQSDSSSLPSTSASTSSSVAPENASEFKFRQSMKYNVATIDREIKRVLATLNSSPDRSPESKYWNGVDAKLQIP